MNKKKPWVSVRVQTPLGLYPSSSLLRDDAALYVDDEIIFSVVKCKHFDIEDDDYYSEVEWANQQEIRYFSSINLARDRNTGLCYVFPFRYTQKIEIESTDSLNDLVLLKEIKNKIFLGFESESVWSESVSVRPPKYSGQNYQFNSDAFLPDLFNKIYASIDPNDHLLIRGLSALIKSQMLQRHQLFLEEAILTLFVALEASFRLVLRKLKSDGIKEPTSSDAHDFIEETFNNNRFGPGKYFEAYYESRIKSMHPESRYGVYPHAPLMADDFYDLYDDLLDVFVYLICDYKSNFYDTEPDKALTNGSTGRS